MFLKAYGRSVAEVYFDVLAGVVPDVAVEACTGIAAEASGEALQKLMQKPVQELMCKFRNDLVLAGLSKVLTNLNSFERSELLVGNSRTRRFSGCFRG